MSNLLQGLNIYLIGMMGSGKTTIGGHLAGELNYCFLDTDQMIEEIAEKSITEIFQQSGETHFRELETKVLAELSDQTSSVISTGGGIIQKKENWKYLPRGRTVWLDVDLEILQHRLAGEEDQVRPLVKQLESLLEQRRPLYHKAAAIHIPIAQEQTPEAITAQIIERLLKII